VDFLPELSDKMKGLDLFYTKLKHDLDAFIALRHTPVNKNDMRQDSGADRLFRYTLQHLPNIGVRKELDGNGVLVFFTQKLMDDSYSADINDEQAMEHFVRDYDSFLNLYDDDARGWQKSANELYDAARKVAWRNMHDYLYKIAHNDLEIDYAANDAYLAAMHIGYLLDLYVKVDAERTSVSMGWFKKSVKQEIDKVVKFLIEAQDPEEAAIQYIKNVGKKKSCFNGMFTCFKAQPELTSREVEYNRIHRAPKKVSTCVGMPVW